jgi:carbon-monoxide dehydrogenase medium subunit
LGNINRQNSHIIPVSFEYYSPNSIKEATTLLQDLGKDAQILAGGTDLIPKMKQRLIEPHALINLKKIHALKGIRFENNSVVIGSLTKLREIEKSRIVEEKIPLLNYAVKKIGSVQIRNMATIGGNICNASPSADSATALIALDAEANINGSEGIRRVPLNEFFTGPGETVLTQGEILKEITIPNQTQNNIWDFIKITRTELDLAVVSLAVNLELNGNRIKKSRIVFGSVAPTPLRLHKMEELLMGMELTEENIEKLSEITPNLIEPISDVRGSRDYRLKVSKSLIKDVLTKARVNGDAN